MTFEIEVTKTDTSITTFRHADQFSYRSMYGIFKVGGIGFYQEFKEEEVQEIRIKVESTKS